MTGPTKFAAIDKDMIERRNKFFAESRELSVQFAVDNWPLFAGVIPIAKLLARYEIMKMTAGVPGHIAEFGVADGANLLLTAKLISLLAPNDLKLCFGFDSWKGLTEFAPEDAAAVAAKGKYAGNRGMLGQMIELHGLGDRVQLVDGLIEQTLPAFIKEHPHYLFSMIYVDTDLYTSTKVILEECWSRVPPGGLVVFDEGYHDLYPGEGTAMNEFLATVPGSYDCGSFPFSRQPMLWVRKR